MIKIVQATTDTHIQDMITLSTEYVTWMVEAIKATYPDIDTEPFLQAHSYENLQSRFPGVYVPPYGRLYLAYNEDHVCGCIALAKWTDTIAEMQTLFVRPDCRGQGVAKKLVNQSIATAKDIGYATIRLDTLAFMISAQTLYQSLGFVPIDPYRGGAGAMTQHIRFFELDLGANVD